MFMTIPSMIMLLKDTLTKKTRKTVTIKEEGTKTGPDASKNRLTTQRGPRQGAQRATETHINKREQTRAMHRQVQEKGGLAHEGHTHCDFHQEKCVTGRLP